MGVPAVIEGLLLPGAGTEFPESGAAQLLCGQRAVVGAVPAEIVAGAERFACGFRTDADFQAGQGEAAFALHHADGTGRAGEICGLYQLDDDFERG